MFGVYIYSNKKIIRCTPEGLHVDLLKLEIYLLAFQLAMANEYGIKNLSVYTRRPYNSILGII